MLPMSVRRAMQTSEVSDLLWPMPFQWALGQEELTAHGYTARSGRRGLVVRGRGPAADMLRLLWPGTLTTRLTATVATKVRPKQVPQFLELVASHRSKFPDGFETFLKARPPLTDRRIRPGVLEWVRSRHHGLVVEELGLHFGERRADVAALGEARWIGVEIKGQTDSLSRLKGQADAYGELFDECWLAAAPNHVNRALDLLPQWWGVLEASGGQDPLRLVRQAGFSDAISPQARAKLLWRDEAYAALREHGEARGASKWRRGQLCEALATQFDEHLLREVVAGTLSSRVGWR